VHHFLRLIAVAVPFTAGFIDCVELRAQCRDCGTAAASACATSAQAPTCLSSFWVVRNTKNFSVCCPSGVDSAEFGKRCESLRDELTSKWLGDAKSKQDWTNRCYVVVHPTTASYLREVGAGGERTLGSSLTKTDRGRIVSRRIDLRGDVSDPLTAALPHELTHVILADSFAGNDLPRWADEGMAMLADPPEKLAGHDRDFDAAVSERRLFHLSQLMTEQDYPAADRRTVFYGESLSIVRYLVGRRTASDFVTFLHLAVKSGNAASLKEVYGIEDLAQLEHYWRSQANLAVR
jgi:hypothetical protein